MSDLNDKQNGIYISVDQIYSLLHETNMRLAEIRSDIRAIADKAESTISSINDHETRIRSLEKWKHAIPLTAVTAISSFITSVLLTMLL